MTVVKAGTLESIDEVRSIPGDDNFSAMVFAQEAFRPLMSKVEELPKIKSAQKFDKNKPDLTLIPKSALDGAAFALMHGQIKYNRYNFLEGGGLDRCRVAASAMRHITAWNDGVDLDDDSGLPHVFHAIAALMMLAELIHRGKGADSRYKG